MLEPEFKDFFRLDTVNTSKSWIRDIVGHLWSQEPCSRFQLKIYATTVIRNDFMGININCPNSNL